MNLSSRFGELTFKRNGSQIENPESIQFPMVISLKLHLRSLWQFRNIHYTVNDRPNFGVCSQGKIYEPIGLNSLL